MCFETAEELLLRRRVLLNILRGQKSSFKGVVYRENRHIRVLKASHLNSVDRVSLIIGAVIYVTCGGELSPEIIELLIF